MMHLGISNCNLNLHTRFNGNGGDLFHYIRRTEKVDYTFVDPQLKSIPCVSTQKAEYSSNIKIYYKTFQSSSKQIKNALLYKNMLYKARKLRSLPSPQGDFLVVMLRTLVGILTGPLTLSFLSLDPRIKSAHTVIQNSYTY